MPGDLFTKKCPNCGLEEKVFSTNPGSLVRQCESCGYCWRILQLVEGEIQTYELLAFLATGRHNVDNVSSQEEVKEFIASLIKFADSPYCVQDVRRAIYFIERLVVSIANLTQLEKKTIAEILHELPQEIKSF